MKARNLISALISVIALMATTPAFSLPQNLPHYNRSDVNASIKEWVPDRFFASTSGVSVIGTGSPEFENVNGLAISGLRILATGQAAHLFWLLPDGACVDCPLEISVVWSTNNSTTTNTATWKVTYGAISVGDVLAGATTALNTVITADSVLATAYMLNETAQGLISQGTFTRGDMIHFAVELDAASGLNPASDVVYLHGVYIDYVREQL